METQSDQLLNNRYRLEHMLGKGGMGAVYLAQDTALDTWVAVKINRNPAPQSSTQFLREARLLASLRHANLPRVTDYFILNEAQYLVMDYIAGKDLETLLLEEGAQPLERVMDWARQLGMAIRYLHEQQPPVIHRDIKPANVRLSTEGEAVLVDFGIAKIFDPSQQSTTTTGSGYTPGFAPPEQYGGSAKAAPYSDQYSFAAMLYHLLTNHKPVDSMQRVLGSANLVPLSELNPALPGYVQAAIERAMSIRPEDRFASIDDFLRTLRLDIHEPEAGRAQPSHLPAQEPPGAAQAVTQAIPAATVQSPVIPENLPPIPPTMPPMPPVPPPAAIPVPKKARKLLWIIPGCLALAALVIIAGAAVWLLNREFGILPAVARQASSTPSPRAQTAVLVTTPPAIAPVEPSQTITPTPSHTAPPSTPTEAPTHTVTPTDTPVPSPTPLPLGGGGVVAFVSNQNGSVYQIWSMRISLNDQGQAVTSDLKQITDSDGDKHQPAWSPDGRRIVYVAPGGADEGLNLWVMNADGSGTPQELTSMKADETEPAWSPDGQWIAFTNNSHSTKARQLFLVNPETREVSKLSYDQEEFGPAWAPDNRLGFVMNIIGSQVLYIRGQADPKTGATPTKAYYVTPVFFDYTALHGSLGQVSEPAWSPDGKWVVYTRTRGSSMYIYTAHYPVRVVEQDIIRLTESNKESSPAWAPDGQWVVFTSARDGNSEIYLMRSTGQYQINLTNLTGSEEMEPAWQPAPASE